MDERQNKPEKAVNFSVGSAFFSGMIVLWLLYELALCFQGFGSDADAWLMAQTAARLAAGLGYDPARSLGNPAWEYFLVLLQPDYQFVFSNAFNLCLALIFLFRLKDLLPNLELSQIWLIRICLALLPVFSEAAASSMELMPAWFLFQECLLALKKSQFKWLGILVLVLSFTRPEFYFLILIVVWFQQRGALRSLLVPGILLGIYLYWVIGKNPAPFEGLESALRFYAGRMWFLFRQAGLLFSVYILCLAYSVKQKNALLRISGLYSLLLFVVFPFEWAYAFPAIFSGLIAFLSALPATRIRLTIGALLLLSLGSDLISPISGLGGLYATRNKMLNQFRQAENFRPQRPCLLVEGATFLPTRFQDWERSHQNRLFNKKGTQFWVGERLSKAEVDSFQKEGFWIGRFSENPNHPWIMEFED